MYFNKHSNLRDRHAFLSPSQYHWVNYDSNKLDNVFLKYNAKEYGTKLHEFAKKAIELGITMAQDGQTLSSYINDAVYYGMAPEQPLYYSENAFGTADAIVFDEHYNLLRIHDLKTGVTKASMTQLLVYDALFCLEYGVSPHDIEIINRIYQSGSVVEANGNPDEVLAIMDKIIIFDQRIEKLKRGMNPDSE